MPASDPGFGRFLWRVIAAHTATYFVAGVLAMNLLDYEAWWASSWMDHYRPFGSPHVAAGAGLQIVRGALFAVALYPFRSLLLDEREPWLTRALRLWVLLAVVGILSTYAAAPGSVEGLIYTALPLEYHLFGLPEVLGQALAFSVCLVYWYRGSRPLGIVLGLLTLLSIAGSTLGIVFG